MSELPLTGARAVLQDIDTFLGDVARMQASLQQNNAALEKQAAAAKVASSSTQDLDKAYKAAADALEKLAGPLLAVGGGLTALSTANVMSAARFETLGIALNRTAANAGYTKEEIAALEASLTKSGISMLGTRELIMRLIQSEVDLADATKLARAAQDLAVVGNRNSTETANDLAYSISSLNGHLLRKYGIFVTIPSALESYGQAMGLTGDELKSFTLTTDQTIQRQAFLNEILNQASAFTGVYEEAMGTAGKAMTSLPRIISDLSVEFGQALLPVLERVVFGLTDLLKWFSALTPETQAFIAQAIAISGGLLLAAGTILAIVPKIYAFTTALGTAKAALITLSVASGGAGTALSGLLIFLGNPVILALAGVALAVVGVTAALWKLGEAGREAAATTQIVVDTYEENVGALNTLRAEGEQYTAQLTAYEQELVKIDLYEKAHGRTLREVSEAQILSAESLQRQIDTDIAALQARTDLTAADRESQIAALERYKAQQDAIIADRQHTIAVLEGIAATRSYVAEVNRWNGQAAMHAQRTAAMSTEQKELTAAFVYGEQSAEGLAAAIRHDREALELLRQGAGHTTVLLNEIARAERKAGDEALTAADKALIYYNALVRVATAERQARIGEAEAIAEASIMLEELTADYEAAGAAGVSSAEQVAQRYEQLEIERVENARLAALDIKYWNEDQNEWILDNEAGLTAELQQEFLARTAAARAQADIVKEDNADLALEILDAEADYQRKKAEIMTIADEAQRAAALAILDRENGERITRAQERAALEAQIEQERLDREIQMMQTAGAAGGKAMADSFATEWEKIKSVFDKTGGWAAEGVVLPDEIVAEYSAWLGRMREEVQKNDWTADQKAAVGTMLDEIEADLNGTTIQIEKDAAAVALAWANAGIDMAASLRGSIGEMTGTTDEFYQRLSLLTDEEYSIEIGLDIDSLPEWLRPTSPKSRLQARLELLEQYTRTHPIDVQLPPAAVPPPAAQPWLAPPAAPAPSLVIIERDARSYTANFAPSGPLPNRGSVQDAFLQMRLQGA